MRTALIAGASGLTGSYLTDMLLESGLYNEVKILVRKPLDKVHPALTQILIDYDKIDETALQADHVYCALGTTIKKAGSRDALKKVDWEYPLKLAQITRRNGAERFAIISAIGAKSNSLFFYNRVKGRLEEDLKDISFRALYIMRPSMLLGPRKEYRFGEEVGKRIMIALSFLFPKNYKPVHASRVTAAMMDYMSEGEEGTYIIPSGKIQKYPVKK